MTKQLYNQLKVYQTLIFDYGTENLRFVAHPNYRLKGGRFDNIEVLLGEGETDNFPAKILFFCSAVREMELGANLPDEAEHPDKVCVTYVFKNCITYVLLMCFVFFGLLGVVCTGAIL